MFVTFYSYKGGVGRSMALANIACLLAEDPEHPQKVLLWDFDLEAPGLHKIFPSEESFKHGFVDLAFEFAEHGHLSNPDEYIYHSTLEGVDVLPAGRVDEHYCAHLERIDWMRFFGDDPSGSGKFFYELTNWMQELPQRYDYVLIDSRTGLNDVAGICTQVLPDLILFVFRLTDQNLDGIEHLVPTIRSQLENRDKHKVEILPVASAVLSQSSPALDVRRKRATSIFKKKSLSYIRFDPDLIAEEKLFCRHAIASAMWPLPPIIEDYRRLCAELRKKNDRDTQTTAKMLESAMRESDYETARHIIVPLLKRRPRLSRAWRSLRRLCNETPEGLKWADSLVKEIQVDAGDNIFVLEWLASKCVSDASFGEQTHLGQALIHMQNAVGLEPIRVDLHRKLSEIASAKGDLQTALSALKTCRKLAPDNIQLIVDLVRLYVRMGQDYFVEALKVLDRGDTDVSTSIVVYLWAFLGNKDSAHTALKKLTETSPPFTDKQYSQVVHAHLLLLAGDTDGAIDIANESIDGSKTSLDDSDISNWAEFFLCAGDFARVHSMFGKKSEDANDRRVLCALADYLAGKSNVTEKHVLDLWLLGNWNFDELLFFRERTKKNGSMELNDRLNIIEKLIQKSLLHSAGGQGSVFWRRSTGPHWRMRLRESRIGSDGDDEEILD